MDETMEEPEVKLINEPEVDESDQIPFWARWFAVGVGVIGGILQLFVGTSSLLMSLLSINAIIGSTIQIFLGNFETLVRAAERPSKKAAPWPY